MVIVNTVDTRNSAWAKDKSGFGHRMLSKMGWKEGKGLGKEGQGQTTNLRGVRQATEALGIGAKTDTHGSDGWGKTNQNFQGVLASLRVQHSEDPQRRSSKQQKKEKKKKKQRSKGLVLAQNRVSAGHARKMRDAKDLSTKSQEDMAAIFGVAPSSFQFPKITSHTSSKNQETNQTISKKEEDPIVKDRTNEEDKDAASHVISDVDVSEEEDEETRNTKGHQHKTTKTKKKRKRIKDSNDKTTKKKKKKSKTSKS